MLSARKRLLTLLFAPILLGVGTPSQARADSWMPYLWSFNAFCLDCYGTGGWVTGVLATNTPASTLAGNLHSFNYYDTDLIPGGIEFGDGTYGITISGDLNGRASIYQQKANGYYQTFDLFGDGTWRICTNIADPTQCYAYAAQDHGDQATFTPMFDSPGGGTPVPEPASLALLSAGLAGFAVVRRARRLRY